MTEFLTTKELAELLRIKERKVYDLAASGEVPCSKALGKLLFPRQAIEAWLAENSSGTSHAVKAPLPSLFLGSHDPLLEWALRESGCGIATFFDSSDDGLARFAAGEGIATGLHLYQAEDDGWNVAAVRSASGGHPAVLIEWARRSRGLIVAEDQQDAIRTIPDLVGKRFQLRQPEAGAQHLFETIAERERLALDRLLPAAPARSEADAALSVLEGRADAAFGLETCARQYRLPFVPVMSERFDLLIDRRAYFEPPLQRLMDFCRSEAFTRRAGELSGYDISGFGSVHYNA